MSKEKRRVPKLRFPGFTEDWEQRKLNEFLSVSNLKNTENKYNKKNVLSVSGDYGIVNQIEFQGRSFAGASVSNYGVVEKGDIVYTKSPLKLNPYGIIKTNRINNGIVSTLYAIYKTKENCDSKFIEHYFNLDSRLNQYLKPLVNKGAKNDMKVSSENALVGEICFPQITEQAMIADLLDRLDIYITLHQRKLDNLKLKKKALLQKLFPKNGERYPELRFPGFTDAWEQRKLTDIAKTFIGLVTTMTENYRDSGTLLIRNSDIKEGQFIFSEKPIHLDEEFAEKNKTRRLQIGDVVTVHTGDIGTSAVIKEKEAGAIGFATINTRTDKRILNPYFLSTYFNTDKHKCYANSVSTGDGRSNYNIKDFNKLVISIPTLDEQEKISAIINNINTIITLHQRKLDHLQLQKKALLQQMFV